MAAPRSPDEPSGLAALIPDDAFDDLDEAPRGRVQRMVPVGEIHPNPDQPREVFDREALETLSASIRHHGVLSPLLVRLEQGRYVLIAGERRLRAAALAGLAEVPVLVRDEVDDADSLELALVENLQRSDLDAIEAARGYQRLIEEFGYTQGEVARRVGRQRATVANAIRLLRLPDFVHEALRQGWITAGHARALVPVEDPADLRALLGRIVDGAMSVRATERLVRAWETGGPQRRRARRQELNRSVEVVGRRLSESLSTSVAVRPREKGGGRIVIDYQDDAHLQRLIEQLGRKKE